MNNDENNDTNNNTEPNQYDNNINKTDTIIINKPLKPNLKLSLNKNKTLITTKNKRSRNKRESNIFMSPSKIKDIQRPRTSAFNPKVENFYISTEEDFNIEEEESNENINNNDSSNNIFNSKDDNIEKNENNNNNNSKPKIKINRRSIDIINPRLNIIKQLQKKKTMIELEKKNQERKQVIERYLEKDKD
jgi:hypothetical protein